MYKVIQVKVTELGFILRKSGFNFLLSVAKLTILRSRKVG